MGDAGDNIFGDFERSPDALLGAGSYGSVWRARQISVQRIVALKVLDRRALDAKDLAQHAQRTHREVNALARLKHRHIVSLYAAGLKDDVPWMAMEYVEGGTLDDEIARRTSERRTFGEPEIARIGLGIAEALLAAKKQGIIHRDLKPTNVLLDREGQPVVTDFGMAKFLDAAEGAEKLTGTDDIVGTPDYMAPEQIFPPEGTSVDHRADVYALGALLHTLATLKPPLSGRSPYETMHKHLNTPPKPIRATNPEYSERLERVLLAALSKSPEQRPTYEEIIDELRSLGKVGAEPPLRVTASRPVGRFVAAGALTLIAAAALTLALWPKPDADGLASREQPKTEPKTSVPAPASEDDARRAQNPAPKPPREEPKADDGKAPAAASSGFLEKLENYANLEPVETALLGELRSILTTAAPDLRRRALAPTIAALAAFKTDARHTEYTRAIVSGAIDLIEGAQAAVNARLDQLQEKASVSILCRDGLDLSGHVISRAEDAITLATQEGERSVAFVDIATADFERALRSVGAIALQVLAGATEAQLARVLHLTHEDVDKALWVPTLVLLADVEARTADLGRAMEVWEHVLASDRAVARLFAWLDADLKRMARELAGSKAFSTGAMPETVGLHPDTRAHGLAAARLLADFKKEAQEDLLDGERAWYEWMLQPDEATVEARRKYWKGQKADEDQEYVWLCDMNASRTIVTKRPVTTAPQGVRIEFQFRAGEVNVAPHFRVSCDAPGMRGAYLRVDGSSASVRRPSFRSDNEDELTTFRASSSSASWRSLTLVAAGDYFLTYLDEAFAFVLPKTDCALGTRFAITVVGSELILKHVWVKPSAPK